MNKDEVKELVVNGERLARYAIEGRTLFLHLDVVAGLDLIDYEMFCITLIEHVERTPFFMVVYLNI